MGTKFEESTGTHFEVVDSDFDTVFEVYTTTFNVVYTVWIFCKCGHENRGLSIYYSAQKLRLRLHLIWHCFQGRNIAQKSKQLMHEKRDSLLVEISLILTVK